MNYLRCLNTIIYTSLLWVIVKCKDNPLKVSPELIHVRQGENIEAKCMLKDLGNFPPDYSFGWNLDKTNGTAVEVSSTGNVKILKIQNVRRHDAGSYRCELSTDGGIIRKILKIIVTDSIHIACNGKYKCQDGGLIICQSRCDGRGDCPLGDDEHGCPKTKEIYPKEEESEDDHTAWLKTTVYTVIACTVGVVLFISIVVIAVCRIKMKRAAVRRAMHQAERRRRHGHHSSDCHGNSSRSQRNTTVEHEPFISAPSPTHFGNIIVNVNNGVQYVPNVDFHSIIQAPPSYQEVVAENQREALIGRHSPPPIYSTIDRNPHRLSSDGGETVNTQLNENAVVESDNNIESTSNRSESNQGSEYISNIIRNDRTNDTVRLNGNRRSIADTRHIVPTFSDNNFQISQSVVTSGRDGTRSLERLCHNRQGGSRSRPNVRSIATPRRPKQLQVRGGQIILDENSSASSSPETVNRNTQTNPADISQSNRLNVTPANQNSDNQREQRDITPPTDNNISSPTQNKPAQLRVQAGQIVLDGQSEVQALMTGSVTNDPDGAASSQSHLEVKDGHIVFKTP